MTQIKDVMSSDFQLMTPDQTVQQAAELMRDRDIGFIPVGENDRLIGMVTDRDIALRSTASGVSPSAQPIRDVITPKTYYCYDDQQVEDVCNNMGEIQVRRLPVVNREKRLVGIVSLGDLAQEASRPNVGQTQQQITAQCSAQNKAAA